MYENIKYRMRFKDLLNKSWEVNFYFKGYTGPITELTGDTTPVEVKFEGEEDDPFLPIRDIKQTINILIPRFNENLYEDLSSGNDKECWVETVDLVTGFKYTGWMLPDEIRRTFDRSNYAISVLVVSPFSLMKGQQLLTEAGQMLFQTQTLKTIIDTCFIHTLPDTVTPAIELVSSYYEAETPSGELFENLSVIMEGFNDSDGKPPTCYDMLQKLFKSFGFFAIWENNKMIISDVYNQNDRAEKYIHIKGHTHKEDFLIGDTESITKIKASKEISLSYNYRNSTGLLINGRFLNYLPTGPDTGIFPAWGYADATDANNNVVRQYNENTVKRAGTGRRTDPYVVRMFGDGGPDVMRLTSNENNVNQGIFNDAFFKAGEDISLDIKFKYKHYRDDYGIPVNEKRVPWLVVFVILQNADPSAPIGWPALKFVFDVQDLPYTTKASELLNTENLSIYSLPSITNPINAGGQYAALNIQIAIDSVDDMQSYNRELGQMPFDGYVTVQIMGAVWIDGQPVPIDPSDQYVDIQEVILSKTGSASRGTVTGEQTYITQAGDYSFTEEMQEAYLGNFVDNTIPGALFRPNGQLSKGVNRANSTPNDVLQNWLLASQMAIKRNPRYRIDVDVLSNSIKCSNVLVFLENGNNLMPDKYMIMRMTHNIKEASYNITAYQLKQESKPYRANIPPDADYDMIENLKVRE